IVHWREIGDIRAEDTEIMEWARQNQFVVFTHDLDFVGTLLYSTNARKPSVIQLRMENIVPSIAGNFVIAALAQVAKELEKGALVTIEPRRHRIRLLPLRAIE
ncbi:hypothetical protein TI03_02810, partial [Achromatium sp. WMS1]